MYLVNPFIAHLGRRIITRTEMLCGLYARETEVVEELGDEDAQMIGQVWFNHHYPALDVTPDSIQSECQKLNVALPNERDHNVNSLLAHIGRQLYSTNVVELDKPYNLQQENVIIVAPANHKTTEF